MQKEPDTLTPALAEELLLVLGGANALYSEPEDPEPRVFWADARRELVATGAIEPLYTWHPGRIEWTTPHRQLVRDWKPPTRERADDLAHGMAAALGAFCSARQSTLDAPSIPYVAVFDVQIRPSTTGAALEQRLQRSTYDVLMSLVAKLTVLCAAKSPAAGPILERYVHDHAAYFRVLGSVVATGLPVAPALGAIAGELATRAPRMKRPGDEPAAVCREIALAARTWGEATGLAQSQ